MKEKKSVSHKGTVIEITEGNIKVEIINKSMCAACHAKGFCSAGDSKDKVIDVPLAILLIFLLTLQRFNLTELQAGLCSILAVSVYYIVIYLFREKIADKFVFTIAKNNI